MREVFVLTLPNFASVTAGRWQKMRATAALGSARLSVALHQLTACPPRITSLHISTRDEPHPQLLLHPLLPSLLILSPDCKSLSSPTVCFLFEFLQLYEPSQMTRRRLATDNN